MGQKLDRWTSQWAKRGSVHHVGPEAVPCPRRTGLVSGVAGVEAKQE